MPLNVDSIVQQKTGDFSATSGTVSLDAATTAGNHVLICAMSGRADGTFANLGAPAGFSWVTIELSASTGTHNTSPSAWIKATAGGETSWTLAFQTTPHSQVTWACFEITGLDQTEPRHIYDTFPDPFDDSGTVSSRSTATIPVTTSYDVLVFALHAAYNDGAAIPGWSGHTNGFSEVADVGRTDGANGIALSVAVKGSQTLTQHECTASLDDASQARGVAFALTAADARWAVTADVLCGFEFGSTTTLSTTSVAAGMDDCKVFDGVVGSPAINSTTPRTGSHCLELSASAAAECVTWVNTGTAPVIGVLSAYGPYGVGGSADTWQGPLVGRLHVYFPTSLPGADVELASIEVAAAITCTIWYRTASQKIAVKIGTGTEIASDAVVSTDTWIGLDFRYDARIANHTLDWQVDYDSTTTTAAPVVQTQAVGASTSAGRITTFRLGWSTAKTATVRYDDVLLSKVWNNYPIGNVKVYPLKVDPAATPTVLTSTANFGVFTNNTTVAAWNAVNARNAIDDIPPTIGATADGVCQVNNSGSDHMKFAMESRAQQPGEIPRAVRCYWTCWAATATAAFGPGLRVYDGTTEFSHADGGVDHGFDASTTIAYWITRMLGRVLGGSDAYLLTQAKLDALEARVGFSTDASPDVGIHAVVFEVAMQVADVVRIIEGEDGAFTVDLRLDSVTSGVTSYLVTCPAGTRGALFEWTISGVDGSQYVAAGATYEKVVGAADIDVVTFVGLTPDPTE
jgi:hypothetical protein